MRWSRDGSELLIIAADGKMMAVPVKRSTSIEFGPPRALFSARIAPATRFDMSKDGSLLGPVEGQESALPPLTVALNWWAELKK